MAAFVSIHDVAVTWDRYRHTLAGLAEPSLDGLLAHLAGPTDEGIRVVDVWDSEDAFERYQRDRLMPALASLDGPVATDWTMRSLRLAHVVLGLCAPQPTHKEDLPC